MASFYIMMFLVPLLIIGLGLLLAYTTNLPKRNG